MDRQKLKEWLGKYKWTIAVIILVLGVMFVKKGLFANIMTIEYNDTSAQRQIAVAEVELRQYFPVRENVTGICAYMVNQGSGQETVTLTLYDGETEKQLAQQNALITGGGETIMLFFTLDTGNLESGQQVYFTISGSDNIYIWATEGQYEEAFTRDGKAVDYRQTFLVTYSSQRDWPAFLLTLAVLLTAAVLVTGAVSKKIPMHRLFLLLAILGGITLAYINPAAQECDGPEHILRSIDVSYGNLLSPFVELNHGDGVITVPENLADMNFSQVNANNGVAYVTNLKELQFADKTIDKEYESSFVSLFYWPQGLGIAIGRLLGLSVFGILLLGRLVNLAVYIALAAWAIRLTPVMKNLFAVIALLPMTLYQSASCSPDSLLVGLCLLFTGLCFSYAYGERETLGIKHALGLGILLVLIFLCKYVYVCIGLLVFLIPAKKFKTRQRYWRAFAIALIPLVLIGLLMISQVNSSVALMTGESNGMSQTQFVLSNPLHFVKILIQTVMEQFSEYMLRLSVLGWLSYSLGPLIVITPCFLAGVALLDTNQPLEKVKGWHKWLGLVTFGLCFALALTGLYVGDGRINPYGAAVVQGFQGRYFIPILIPGLMMFSNFKVKNHIENFSCKVLGWSGIFLGLSALMLRMSCY